MIKRVLHEQTLTASPASWTTAPLLILLPYTAIQLLKHTESLPSTGSSFLFFLCGTPRTPWLLSFCSFLLFLFFFKILLIYSWETCTEREREAETRAEGEAGPMQGAWCGTWSRDSRITPWAEGSAKPMSHLGLPTSCSFLMSQLKPCFFKETFPSPQPKSVSYARHWIDSLSVHSSFLFGEDKMLLPTMQTALQPRFWMLISFSWQFLPASTTVITWGVSVVPHFSDSWQWGSREWSGIHGHGGIWIWLPKSWTIRGTFGSFLGVQRLFQ